MADLTVFQNKWETFRNQLKSGVDTTDSVWSRIKSIIGVIVMCLYRLRKVFLAIPVIHYALKIANYNRQHLPEQVGINLQATGEFAMMISREMAVTGPLVVTAACLVLMFGCRKALYPFAVSLFTLLLPVLLLISNLYPV